MLFALVVSATANVDSLEIAKTLRLDSGLRASIVAAAQEAAKLSPPATSEASLATTKDLLKKARRFEPPIGWSKVPEGFPAWSSKIAGLLCTTIAASLGASFRFDALRKLASLRSAGKQPEKKPEEKRT